MSHLSYMCFPSAQRSIDCPTPCIAVFISVYRPVGQSVARHLMVNVSNARRESRSRKGIRDINHQWLEAWECVHRVFLSYFCLNLQRASAKSVKSVFNQSHSPHPAQRFYFCLSPCGQSVVRHLMVNVSNARRESRSRKGIRDINHQWLEAWEYAHREFLFCFCHNTPHA